MALSRYRRHHGNALDAWPGYVDALSTLLMVIIFVLLVFVLAQAFLTVSLSGKDRALDQLGHQVAALSNMLSLERGQTRTLQLSVASLTETLKGAEAARDDLAHQLAAVAAERDTLRGERGQTGAALATLAAQSATAQLLTAGQLATLRAQNAELARIVTADRATVQARLADLAQLTTQVQALTALRDELEAQTRDAAARATTADQQRAAVAAQLADEQKFSDSARAQIALLNRQLDELRAQMLQLSADLDLAHQTTQAKDAQIASLGQRLNVALASKVEELQRYRSEFFGRLRAVLANRPGIQIVGDRFVFQSEVLFPVGSADLSTAGHDEISALANTLKSIIPDIPKGLNWILRVDGHADRLPLAPGSGFASNWELSSQRAINVVKLLIADGIPPDHLAATGFADFQPLDTANTPAAYARNRRIELRLTDR